MCLILFYPVFVCMLLVIHCFLCPIVLSFLSLIHLFLELFYYFYYYLLLRVFLRVEVLGQSHLNFGSIIYIYIYIYIELEPKLKYRVLSSIPQ